MFKDLSSRLTTVKNANLSVKSLEFMQLNLQLSQRDLKLKKWINFTQELGISKDGKYVFSSFPVETLNASNGIVSPSGKYAAGKTDFKWLFL